MPTIETQHEPKRWKILLPLFLVWLALRLPLLFRCIWFDEAFRTFVVLNPASIKDLLLHDVHNPLYNAFMYGWIRVFGDSEPRIRVPTLLAGAGVIWIVWVWCKSHWGERAAWWSAAWLVVNPVHAYYSCEAKNNMVTVLFAALTLWRWDVMARDVSKRNVLLAILAGSLAIWTDFQSLLLLPAVWIAWIVVLARDSQRPRAWMPALWCVVGTLALSAPLLAFKAANMDDLDRSYLRYFHVHEPLRLLCVYFPTGNSLFVASRSNWPVAALMFAPLVVPALVAGWLRVRNVSAGRVVLVSMLAPIAITLVGSEGIKLIHPDMHMYQERNLLVMMPGLAIVLGVGMSALRARLGNLSRCGLLLVGLLSSIALATWNSERATIMPRDRPDWRAAAKYIHHSLGKSVQPTLVVSRTPLLAMRYYMPEDRVVDIVLPQSASANAIDATDESDTSIVNELRRVMAANGTAECWIIHSDNWRPLTEQELAAIGLELEVFGEMRVSGLVMWRVQAK